MINVAVYGKLKWSEMMKSLLENEYSDFLEENGGERIKVEGFLVDAQKEGQSDTFLVADFAKLYHEGKLAALIIPKEYYMQYNVLLQELIKAGINVNDIYNGIRLSENIQNRKSDLQRLITPMLSDSFLPYLEYHVTDHCNLNCKFCSHYSPLVDEPVFTDIDKLEKDLRRLKLYIEDIGVIRILGGEPLLNPELPDFIERTRRIYPGSVITVVTNGMLLDRITPELIKTMDRNLAFFHISYYPPLEAKIDEIKKFLVDKKIPYTISPKITEFNKTQRLCPSDNTDFFYDCMMATCNCLYDGMIAQCYAPYTTKYFNKAFDTSIPGDEGIDLYNDENTTEDIKLKLLSLEQTQGQVPIKYL